MCPHGLLMDRMKRMEPLRIQQWLAMIVRDSAASHIFSLSADACAHRLFRRRARARPQTAYAAPADARKPLVYYLPLDASAPTLLVLALQRRFPCRSMKHRWNALRALYLLSWPRISFRYAKQGLSSRCKTAVRHDRVIECQRHD